MRSLARFGFVVLAALPCAPAHAAFHFMKLVEVYGGSAAAPDAQYVVLQMYEAGQNQVAGHYVRVHAADGATIQTFTFAAPVANGANQATILVATPRAQALFDLAADLTIAPVVPGAGGKVCFDAIPEDCVAWGAYTGASTGVGTPYNAPAGLVPGRAARRRLDVAGSPTLLEAADDRDQSSNDFVDAAPAPRNNAGATTAAFPLLADGFEDPPSN